MDRVINMNKVDTNNKVISGRDPQNTLGKPIAQEGEAVHSWDQLTDEQQQDILAHLTAIPFQ